MKSISPCNELIVDESQKDFILSIQWDPHEILKSRFYVVIELISRGPGTF